jgi:YfiH family protein
MTNMIEAIKDANLGSLKAITHGFFTRAGGVSDGVYNSLNTGFGSNDDADCVAENRARTMHALGLAPERLSTAYQVHSARISVIEAPVPYEDAPRVDGFVTATPGIALGILSADCAPILLADPTAGVIGAAHAGWRGALTGVIDAAVDAMEGLGATRADIHAAIGPCIGQASYEVGPDFSAPFLAHDAGAHGFFTAAARAGHFMFDLEGYAAHRLGRLGLANVCGTGLDTCAREDAFFSYRRATLKGENDYGRGLSVIALEE